jgi:transcriptional regulator GlxA family with amidase domain
VFLKRPGGQSQFSSHLAAQEVASGALRDLPAWIVDHLDEDLAVERLAARAAMSPRNFARVFRRRDRHDARKYVERARVEAARRRLEDGRDGSARWRRRAASDPASTCAARFSVTSAWSPTTIAVAFRRTTTSRRLRRANPQGARPMTDVHRRRLGVVLFPVFELLDVFGPLEMFGILQDRIELVTVAERPGRSPGAGPASRRDPRLRRLSRRYDLLLVPGGFGTRIEATNAPLIDFVRARAKQAELTMSVCSGSLLLAAAGLLDGRRATTNKMFFGEISAAVPAVNWVREARWVEDGPSSPRPASRPASTWRSRLIASSSARRPATSWRSPPSTSGIATPRGIRFARAHGLV